MSPAAPSTDLVVASTQELAEIMDTPELQMLWKRATLYSSGNMLQKDLRGRPADTMAIMLSCVELGLTPSPINIKQFHLIDGTPEPSAQLTLGLATAAGYETKWGRNDDELAELHIRRYGDKEWQSFTFSIEQARKAHLLDEWVEHWSSDEKGRNHKDTWILGSDVTKPPWAQKEIDGGRVKRRDNWHNYPGDMLCARVAKRAVKRAAPEVPLGLIDHIRSVPAGEPSRLNHVLLTMPKDPANDDITDAELVDFDDGGEPFEDLEPEQQPKVRPEVQPEMVSGEKAKWELVEAAMAEGLVELAARALAAQVWQSYHFNELGGAIPRKSLDIVLEEVRREAQKASAAAAQPSGEAGTNPAAAAEDTTTLFGGES